MNVPAPRPISLALVAGPLLLLLAAPRGAAALECGDAIVEDTTLDRDLLCTGDGLVIAADGITVDLGGHTIRGAGPYTFGDGIVLEGRTGVSVRNGRLEGFLHGVALDHTDASKVEGLTLRGCQVAMSVWDSNGNHIARNLVENEAGSYFTGIMLVRSTGNELARNTVTRTANPLELYESSDNTISGNVLRSAGNHGLLLGFYSLRNVVEANVVVDAGHTGIFVHNGAEDTLVVRNDVRRSRFDGIQIGSDAIGTQLTANIVSLGGWNGIHVLDASATLTGNIAVRNAALGIDAVPGVIDGGGNVAAGNGGSVQCAGVSCAGK